MLCKYVTNTCVLLVHLFSTKSTALCSWEVSSCIAQPVQCPVSTSKCTTLDSIALYTTCTACQPKNIFLVVGLSEFICFWWKQIIALGALPTGNPPLPSDTTVDTSDDNDDEIVSWDKIMIMKMKIPKQLFLHLLPSQVPQPTCSWHPSTCQLGNPTTTTKNKCQIAHATHA